MSIEKYLHLNPFIKSYINEVDIWGNDDDFQTVNSINKEVLDVLCKDIEEVRNQLHTRVRFLVGSSGSGKSHIISCLRRYHSQHAYFTYVSNPPLQHWEISRHMLQKIIWALGQPVRENDRVLEYSQMRQIVYGLLMKTKKFARKSFDKVHKKWTKIKKKHYPKFFNELMKVAGQGSDLKLTNQITKVLLSVLDHEKENLALEWLSGSSSMSNKDLEIIDAGEPMSNSEIKLLLTALGHLTKDIGPILIVLDQLDRMKNEHIEIFETILFDLFDSTNFYVVISLLEDVFDTWSRHLTVPLKQRIGTPSSEGSLTLPIVHVRAIHNRRNKRALIFQRLSSEELIEMRQKDKIEDPLFPFNEEILENVLGEDPLFPRILLNESQFQYRSIITGAKPEKEELSATIAENFAEIRESINTEELITNTTFIADRISELFEIILKRDGETTVTYEDGPFVTDAIVNNFIGSDRVFSLGDTRIRVIGYDVQQGSKFPSVLRKIVDAPPNTILFRDAKIPTTGKVTQDLLEKFQKDKTFILLDNKDIRDLYALGRLLAKMRQGDFHDCKTDPDPTSSNIMDCLSKMSILTDKEIVHEFKRMAENRTKSNKNDIMSPSKPYPEQDWPAEEAAEVANTLAHNIKTIMSRERWICFERLLYLMYQSGVNDIDQGKLISWLHSEELRELLEIYPTDPEFPKQKKIIVWKEESLNA
ncbi:MAG: P-loop NTPase fold protein [Candidatus Scalindua sp.]|nr:P-loop NTPase fold protein [Candidatus Scalindua sp.]